MSERREHRHWNLLRRAFGFRDCRDAGAAKAAEVLGVERELLRAHYDVNLTASSRNALAVKLLAHADERVAAAEKALAEAVALRNDCWIAEQVSGRDMTAADFVTFTNAAGVRETFDVQPHELFIKELLEEEFV
jgi:hypothetical protein